MNSTKTSVCIITADGHTTTGMHLTGRQGIPCRLIIRIPRKHGITRSAFLIKNDNEKDFKEMPLTWIGLWHDFDLYEAWIPTKETGLFWFYARLHGFGGEYLVCRNGSKAVIDHVYEGFHAFQFTVYDRHMTTPAFIKGGLFYHIFVDRFAKGEPDTRANKHVNPERPVIIRDDWGGEVEWRPDEHGEILNNDFFGGNLAGIREKLPYLKSMGVTCIYLSPIFEAYSNHKYDTSDYSKIDPMFGDEEEFKKLCVEADERGIRIILDGVFNHTGADSIYFNKFGTYGAKTGAFHDFSSPYHEWYNFIKYPRVYNSWWGIMTLPTINKDSASYRNYLFSEDGIIRKWLRFGASGWRLDVADELSDDFLMQLKAAARAEKSDALVLGEVWEDASNKIAYGTRKKYFQGRELDSVMNYPLKNAIVEFVRNGNAETLEWALETELENYPPEILDCLMNLLGTHDTARILTVLGGKILPNDTPREIRHATKMDAVSLDSAIGLLKLAALIQMMVPGVPCIYYGDEVGMEGYNDPFNRACYPWGHENTDLQEYYRKLSTIRCEHRLFIHSNTRVLYARDSVFIFERYTKKEHLICGINRGYTPFVFDVPGQAGFFKDLLTGEVPEDTITLFPYGSFLIFREK